MDIREVNLELDSMTGASLRYNPENPVGKPLEVLWIGNGGWVRNLRGMVRNHIASWKRWKMELD